MEKNRLNELYTFDLDAGLIISRKTGRPAGSKMKEGYLQISVDGRKLYVHRVIFFMKHGYLPKLIDHINMDRVDNRIENLRELTHSQNLLNRNGPKGIYFNKKNGKWAAQIGNKYLGSFATEAEALEARKLAVEVAFLITPTKE